MTLQLARRVLPLPSAALMSSRLGLVGIPETHRVRAKVPGHRGAVGLLMGAGPAWAALSSFTFPSWLFSPASRWAASGGVIGGVLSFSRWVALVV